MRQKKEVMTLAWQIVRRNGYTISEALKCAWRNVRLRRAMADRVCRFTFKKVDGSIREAYGTLCSLIVPATSTPRKADNGVQVFWDAAKFAWRSYRRENLLSVTI